MDTWTSESGSSRRRLAAATAVLALSLVAAAIAFTGAIFTDTQSVGSNTFTTGNVDISTDVASALLTASNMAPGDRTNAAITASNPGTLQLRYAIQGSATNTDSKNLRGSLSLRVALRGGASCDFPYFNTDGTTTTLTDDTQLYSGAFPTSTTAVNIVGDAAQGGQAGDRTLSASGLEVLCFSVVLPTSAGNSVQTATTTATFDFVAEQTANN